MAAFDRDKWERALAERLGEVMARQLARLMDLLASGEQVSVDNVPADYWQTVEDELAAAMSREMEGAALDSAAALMQETTIGIEWGLVNQRAANWARQYSYELVRDINNTTRNALQDKIAAFFEEQQTLADLRASLEPLYGPVRADLIASTEITRAASRGEDLYVSELNSEGVQLIDVWDTSEDELVCPICRPLNGKRRGDGWQEPPPAHPRCRCGRRWVVADGR